MHVRDQLLEGEVGGSRIRQERKTLQSNQILRQTRGKPWGKQRSSLSESRLVTEQRLLQVGHEGGLTQGASVQVRQNLMALTGMGRLLTTPLGAKASSPSTDEVTSLLTLQLSHVILPGLGAAQNSQSGDKLVPIHTGRSTG